MVELEFARLELERGADVDRLAIAPHVLEGGHAIPLNIIAHTARERDFLRQRIRAADIEGIIVRLAQRRQRTPIAPVRANRDSAGEPLERVADTHNRALAAAER